MQRIAVIVLGIVFLLAFIVGANGKGRFVFAFLVSLSALCKRRTHSISISNRFN
jgi:hypothetical protein